MINHLSVITPNYPISGFVERGAFVANLVEEWITLGKAVDVIAPISYPTYFRSLLSFDKNKIDAPGNHVYEPKYLSLSDKRIFSLNLAKINSNCFVSAVLDIASKANKPDAYYGKFLMSGGLAVSRLSLKYKKPSFVDLGESYNLESMCQQDLELAKYTLKSLSGAIVVSERLEAEIINLGMDKSKVLYLPNGINNSRFKPLDKMECRKKLLLPEDKFISIFVGHFIERKGPLRVLKAMELTGLPIYGVFIGRGNLPPHNLILKAGSVPNDELPMWLNAADVFVLPTLAEGNCNAINEAMGCGLPVISSDIPDIKSQLSSQNAVLIDPLNIKALSDSLKDLYLNSDKRTSMSSESLKIVANNSLSFRAKNIIGFMEDMVS